jgi:hypothetical protein
MDAALLWLSESGGVFVVVVVVVVAVAVVVCWEFFFKQLFLWLLEDLFFKKRLFYSHFVKSCNYNIMTALNELRFCSKEVFLLLFDCFICVRVWTTHSHSHTFRSKMVLCKIFPLMFKHSVRKGERERAIYCWWSLSKLRRFPTGAKWFSTANESSKDRWSSHDRVWRFWRLFSTSALSHSSLSQKN